MRTGMGLAILLTLCVFGFAQEKPSVPSPEFKGTYAQLGPAQKALIDDWYAEYNTMMQHA